MKTVVIGQAIIPDGYSKDKDKVKAVILFDPTNGKTYQVYPWGWCTLHPYTCMDEIEAEWIAKNHPYNKGRIQFI